MCFNTGKAYDRDVKGLYMDISFVIPMYNAEKYIEETLNSINNSVSKDVVYEIIVIDDGSSDKSVDIVLKHDEVKLLRQVHQGPSEARNKGVDVACGKWICFVDADDILARDFDKIFKLLLKSEYDVIYFKARFFKNHIPLVEPYNENLHKTVELSDKQIEKVKNEYLVRHQRVDGLRYSFETPWAKIYKAETIRKNNIRFPIGLKFNEDSIFNYYFLGKVTKCACCDFPLYYAREVKSSLTHAYMENIVPEITEVSKAWKNALREEYPNYYTPAYGLMVYFYLHNYLDSYLFHYNNSMKIKDKKKKFRETFAMPQLLEAIEKCKIEDVGYLDKKNIVNLKENKIDTVFNRIVWNRTIHAMKQRAKQVLASIGSK